MDRPPAVSLHLTSLAILAPNNAPLYVHAYTGKDDELRAYHLAHAAVDVIEERIVMTSSPSRPADSYLGLLFCMEDMAFYGFQTPTKLRFVLSVALVDAAIKDADIVAIFRAVHYLLLSVIHDPFRSLPETFGAKHVSSRPPPLPPKDEEDSTKTDSVAATLANTRLSPTPPPCNEPIPEATMFATGPDDIRPEWLANSARWNDGVERLGELLCGSRT